METKRKQTFVTKCSTGAEYTVVGMRRTCRGEYRLVLKDAEGRRHTVDLEELLQHYYIPCY